MIGPEMEPLPHGPWPLPRREAVDSITFFDASQVQWRVTERDTRDDPGAHGDWCLIFASPDAVRRVWHYPANWRELPARALVALSWSK